jgi:Ras family protein T1
MDDETSKEKLLSYWLPKINEIEESSVSQSIIASSISMNKDLNDLANTSSNNNLSTTSKTISSKKPIILVANKLDKVNGAQLTRDPIISQLIVSNSQIETCVQCSAKTLKNVPEVFYYAQKSVLYPTAPIYDIEAKKLTSLALRSLTRIFKIVDQDNDGILNDNELNEFQLKCFGIRLNLSSLQEVKSLLLNNNQNSSENENLKNNEITLKGFLYLHTLFIKKGRHETTWTVLKKFGYDKNLSITRDYSSIK